MSVNSEQVMVYSQFRSLPDGVDDRKFFLELLMLTFKTFYCTGLIALYVRIFKLCLLDLWYQFTVTPPQVDGEDTLCG